MKEYIISEVPRFWEDPLQGDCCTIGQDITGHGGGTLATPLGGEGTLQAAPETMEQSANPLSQIHRQSDRQYCLLRESRISVLHCKPPGALVGRADARRGQNVF